MVEDYEFVKRVFSNIRSLRAFARECSYEWLEEASQRLNSIIDERKSKYQQEQKEKEEFEKKRAQAISMLAEMGLTPNQLISGATPRSHPKNTSKKPKYIYVDENGVEKTWAGVGRKPETIETALNEGKSLDDFLIKKDT